MAGPVQRCVSSVVPQRRQRRHFGTGDAQQLHQPGRVAAGRSQVDGGETSGVGQQDRSFLLHQTLDTFLLAAQQLRKDKTKPAGGRRLFRAAETVEDWLYRDRVRPSGRHRYLLTTRRLNVLLAISARGGFCLTDMVWRCAEEGQLIL